MSNAECKFMTYYVACLEPSDQWETVEADFTPVSHRVTEGINIDDQRAIEVFENEGGNLGPLDPD